MRVLVVEDDRRLARALMRGLREAGLRADAVGTADEAVDAVASASYDVIVLDVMLPGGRDGFSVCAELRRSGLAIPVLMLTAGDSVDDRVRGLEAGADDYLVKPFALRELVARIRAVTRRHQPPRSSVVEVGDVRLDADAWTVTIAGHPVALTPKEFAILELLMQNAGRLLSRTQIEEQVWDTDLHTESNLLEVYIARLRRKLGAGGATDLITTIRGAGYRLESDGSCVPSSGAPASA
ncbi:MAG: response regulator transcription factor [Chloroflexi bacterium]|nr:MAG: response regulator transcription factor [Chloroflexota bacterium]